MSSFYTLTHAACKHRALSYLKCCALYLFFFMLLVANSQAQTLLAGWDFQTTSNGGTAIATAPNTPVVIQANVGSGTIYLNGSIGSSAWITATTGNQLTAFSGTTVNATGGFSTVTTGAASLAMVNSSANGKALVFALNMANYASLQITYATQRTSSGFTSQSWEYSSNATTWFPLTTVTTIPTAFGIQTINTGNVLNNTATAYLRMTVNGATTASGNNRLDNIQFLATFALPAPVVVPANLAATVGQAFSYQVIASNSPNHFSATGLPAGLSIDTNSGIISGIPVSAGNAITASIIVSNGFQSGAANFTFNVGKGTQAITFPALPALTYGDAPFALNAIGGASGQPVTYISSDTSIATITGNQLSVAGAGTCVITASQAGDNNYFAAADVQQILVIGKASQTIMLDTIADHWVTDPPFLLQANGGASGNPVTFSSSNPSVASVNGNTVTVNAYGTVQITASQNGNANFFPAVNVSRSLTVRRLPQTITFTPLAPRVAGNPAFTLTATGGASGNPITYSSSNPSVATVAGNVVTINAAGNTLITASQAGNSIYNAAADVTQSLIVSASTQQLTYTFGTGSSPTALPTIGLPISHASLSAVSQGNNANTSQTVINLTTTSASNYSGASAEYNAGITEHNRNFQKDSSGYFELTLTPDNGYSISLRGISFGTRSTSTGPTQLDIRTSLDAYSTALVTLPVNANANWAFVNPVFTAFTFTAPLTVRIYGYAPLGTANITGGSANNWRLDDIKVLLSVNPLNSCSISLNTTLTHPSCHGGTGQISASATNANGNPGFTLNNGITQPTGTFTSLPASVYTLTVTDAYFCSATTILTITQPAELIVSASNASGCNGEAISLQGFPQGGTFSIPNPYTGPSTTFTYSYTDANGCTAVSPSATVSISPCAVINMHLYIQAYYAGSGFMVPALYNQGVSLDPLDVDYIRVELHKPVGYTLIATVDALLHTNGNATASFPNISGYYYIVVKHRNSLQTWSSAPVLLGSMPISYDLSSNACQSFQCNLALLEPGVYGLYNGDLNQDDNIDLLDLPMLESDIENFTFGYYSTDLNGDGNVDLLDLPVVEENIANFVFAGHPSYIAFPETMEDGVKTVYTTGTVNLQTGVWTFEDALVGTSSSDRKTGAKSARIQNTGSITMNFNTFIDTSVVTIWHARYSTEANSTWALFVSTDNGLNWTQQGSTVTTSSTTLSSASFTINAIGNMRFRVKMLSGGRLNIDDIGITANAGVVVAGDNDHLALGNPSNAQTDVSFPDNYLLIKPQFDLAYDNSKGTAAWVAWHLDNTDMGNTPRCDCFTTDMQLPASFYRASSSAYTGTGFDRGHQVPSAQRDNTITNNAATFLMSNIMPQSPNLNQLTWNNLEQYCISLANSGYELYTYSGGYGSGGTGSNGGITYTIAGGNITVPSNYWKVIVILPVGNNDVSRVTASTRIIAVDMPNTQTVSNLPWGSYRTSVDAIEAATGFDFLGNLPAALQTTLEAMVDAGPVN